MINASPPSEPQTMDFGYPQTCAVDVLRLYINFGTVRAKEDDKSAGQLTSQITGVVDWRREGLRYKKNEVHIGIHDVFFVTSYQRYTQRCALSSWFHRRERTSEPSRWNIRKHLAKRSFRKRGAKNSAVGNA